MSKEDVRCVVAENDLLSNEQPVWEINDEEEEEESQDWLETKDPKHFVMFLQKEINRFPSPNSVRGNVSLIEQSLGQWKRLDAFVSKALREDYEGVLNLQYVDKVRSLVDRNIESLEDMLDSFYAFRKKKRQLKKRHADSDAEMVKNAGTAEFTMIVTPFQRAIAGMLVNGNVSGGKNIEELWDKIKEKYSMTEREELEIMQIMADMGYPIFKDRFRIGDEVHNPQAPEEESKGEWPKQYYG